jgi:hypothetical protein
LTSARKEFSGLVREVEEGRRKEVNNPEEKRARHNKKKAPEGWDSSPLTTKLCRRGSQKKTISYTKTIFTLSLQIRNWNRN